MVTTPPVPPGRPEEHDDPTGVRALLAGLGDPGPMPAELVDRINASIAAEQLARGAQLDRTVVPLRRAARRPSWAKVGLAAAAVAAVAVAVPAMLGSGPGDVMASLAGRSNAASDSAGSAGGAEAGGSGAPDVGNRAASSTGAVLLGASGTSYTSAGLTTQVRSVLDRHALYGASKSSAATRGATSEQGLRDCLTALGVASWMPVAGDVGSYDGRPAVVAVVSSDTGQSVYAVAPECDASHPALLAGPLRLP